MRPREHDELDDEFEITVQRQRARIEQGRREKGATFWRYLGLIGAVGWSVVVPMVLGVLLGRFIDSRGRTTFEWTLALLVLGLGFGCYNAWRLINKEH